MKHILLFGAGKSSTVLIGYLKNVATEKNWRVTVADADLDTVVAKTGGHPRLRAMGISIADENGRKALVEQADVVISLLPPALHYPVALDCLALGKHLLTASYVDEQIKALAGSIETKKLLFLCEMGLDPGIDHMSAMQIIHRIEAKGGQVRHFRSHCGGLVAPESDNNPWHYKISWNPRNIVLAGKAGAVFRENGVVKQTGYTALFAGCSEVDVAGVGPLASYPNRDSLSYLPVYHLDNCKTFVRTTLRHPDFCKGWNLVVQAGLTSEENTIDTDGLSTASFLQEAFRKTGVLIPAEQEQQFAFLGWNDPAPINKGVCSYADALQSILEKKWKLEDGDRDMIVMLHEIGYRLGNTDHEIQSALVVKGNDPVHTAMAKTVGLPLGIAATLLLEGKIRETGLHIPIIPGIYEPVLSALAAQGIVFHEKKRRRN